MFTLNFDTHKSRSPRLTIYKTTVANGATSPVWSYTMAKTASTTNRVFAHSHIEYVAPGDRITLTSSQHISKVNFKGFKLAT